ncbi:hypothetical protein KM043_012500 [Ampulex compressa]|nr:hypothetical protein KM043_012500 [Ampulex compressa]
MGRASTGGCPRIEPIQGRGVGAIQVHESMARGAERREGKCTGTRVDQVHPREPGKRKLRHRNAGRCYRLTAGPSHSASICTDADVADFVCSPTVHRPGSALPEFCGQPEETFR